MTIFLVSLALTAYGAGLMLVGAAAMEKFYTGHENERRLQLGLAISVAGMAALLWIVAA